MLILTLVCVAWLEIIGIQSAKKEARRREAVERLAGMMDAFMYVKKSPEDIQTDGYYVKNVEGRTLRFDSVNSRDVHPVFGGGESPIGYQLCIVERTELPKMGLLADVKWGNGCGWLVGRLYERTGLVGEVGKPFFTLSVNTGVELIW